MEVDGHCVLDNLVIHAADTARMTCALPLDIDPSELDDRRDGIISRIYTRVEVQDLGFSLDGQPSPCHIWTGPDSGDGRGGGYGRMSQFTDRCCASGRVYPLLRVHPG